jgi:hypothetical protein
MSLPRRVQILVSVFAMLIAAGIQYYLAKIVYPEATYGDTPVFQLLLQFKEARRLIPFAVFIPPYVWLIRTLIRRKVRLEGPSAAIVLGSVIYMGMWWLVGRVEEVRIFLPFAMAVVPITGGVAMKQFLKEPAA